MLKKPSLRPTRPARTGAVLAPVRARTGAGAARSARAARPPPPRATSTDAVQTVLDLTAGTRRGKSADAACRAAVVAAVRALEANNPTPRPTASDLLAGDWALLWTGPADPTDAAWEKRSGGLEGPVLSALAPVGRVLGLAGGAVIQSIDTVGREVHNVATFKVLGQPGSLDVEGDVVVASPTRVDVTFTRFTLRVGGLPAISIPLTAVSPTGWVETTYLDERLRVGRGDKGSLFVTARVPANGPLAADKRKG